MTYCTSVCNTKIVSKNKLFSIASDFIELCQKGIKYQSMIIVISNLSQTDVNMFTKPQTAVKHETKPQTLG